jgi:hypothetical protein
MTSSNILEKYKANKPLKKSFPDSYPERCDLYYNKFEEPKQFDVYKTIIANKLPEKNYNIVFGVKASPDELESFDFLWCHEGPAFVVHKRVVHKLNDLCPNDIQVLPVTIKNLDQTAPKFVNKSFYLINILKLADIYDKSYIIFKPGRKPFPRLSQKVFNENCMNGALLARDYLFEPPVFFHPSLAKHFIKSKGIRFLTETEHY